MLSICFFSFWEYSSNALKMTDDQMRAAAVIAGVTCWFLHRVSRSRRRAVFSANSETVYVVTLMRYAVMETSALTMR